MHPVLLLTHNNLDLTKRCVESICSQDLKTTIEIIDNGSTDGTPEWLSEQGINNSKLGSNYGVSVGWNQGLRYFFELPHHFHSLCFKRWIVKRRNLDIRNPIRNQPASFWFQ